jgi:hypothetical protein
MATWSAHTDIQRRQLGHRVNPERPAARPHWARIGALDPAGLPFTADGSDPPHPDGASGAPGELHPRFSQPTRPDLIVTDYEPITAWMARRFGLRSVGIGHQYAFAWPQVPRAKGNLITRSVMDLFAPVSIPAGTHWDAFGAPVLPPTVDPEIRAVARGPVESDLVVVYLGFEPLERLVPLLQRFRNTAFTCTREWQQSCSNGTSRSARSLARDSSRTWPAVPA